MSRLRFNKVASPSNPAAGKAELFVDAAGLLKFMLETGTSKVVSEISNFSTVAQSITAATRTYIAGSQIAIPATKLQIGTTFRWSFTLTKTAAGIATSTFDLAFGTVGTVTDTARVSFTKPAGTAVADEGTVEIIAVVRGPLSSSGIVVGNFFMAHNLAATGHAAIPCVVVTTVSSAFDVTLPTFAGVCITSGASDAVTIQMVMAEAWNL